MRGAKQLVVTALIAVGCGSQTEYFRPTEQATAEGTEGEPASSYEIQDEQGKLGEVTVWSEGAAKGEVAGREPTLVHIGMRVENLGDEPLAVDRNELRVEAIDVGDETLPRARLIAMDPPGGNLTVRPGSEQDFDLYFEVPAGLSPDDLDGFRLRWAVVDGDRKFLQFTPFVEDEYAEGAWYPAYGYYDPWFYGSWWWGPSTTMVVHQPAYVPVQRDVVIREHGSRHY
jgi:hypothetical protein